jgi:hypothetical protein
MAADSKIQSRWRSTGLVVIGICVAAVMLRLAFFAAKPAEVGPEPAVTPIVDPPRSTTAVDSRSGEVSPTTAPHALDESLQAAYKAREVLNDVHDYSAVFDKREQVGRKLVATKMNLKVRVEPFSVYLKFVEPKAVAGRQVVFVKGSNSNNLLVQEAGYKSILGIQPLQPTGSLAMADNRYPVTMIGLQKMLDLVIAQWEADRAYSDVSLRIEDAKLATGEACTVYESSVPTPRDKVQFHITRLWIDQQTHLAVRVEQLGFPPPGETSTPVLEDYTYSNIRTNVGLSDVDFDAKKAFQP